MRMSLLFILFTFCSSLLFSQEQIVEKTKIVQLGTEKLVNGKAEILLEKYSTNDYFVILTSIGEYAELFVETMKPDKFVVKSKNTLNSSFNYVVIEKKVKKKLIDDQIDIKNK